MNARVQLSPQLTDTVPQEYADHPLITSRVFYTLPRDFLDLVVQGVGRDRFEPALLEMEFVLSDLCSDHTAWIGFAAGTTIQFNFLRDRALDLNSDELEYMGILLGPQQEAAMELMRSRLNYVRRPARGYLGWLLTNPTFLDEHDELLRSCAEFIQRGCDLPVAMRTMRRGTELPEGWNQTQSRTDEWISTFRDFCARWRLIQLAGPYLPQPLQPHLPSPFSDSGVANHVVPDVFPVEGRGTFREIVNDSVRAADDVEHLTDWLEIVGRENSARNRIGHFARLLELQHFVRVLQQRHPGALHRNRVQLQDVLADFFGVSLDSIRKDWRFIDRRLGRDWSKRRDPFDR